MAADGTQIKNDIDTDLANKGYRGVRVSNVISALKKVVDWVTGAVNGNLSTWLRTADNQPGGANTDAIYREGSLEVRGGSFFKMRTPTGASLANVPFSSQNGLQLLGTNSGPAFLEFHLPGFLIHQLGVDTDGVLRFHPWGTSAAYGLVIDAYTTSLRLANSVTNRKLVVYDGSGNEHQFFGFGIGPGALRYQISSSSEHHIFYAGASPVSSLELMRLGGNGNLSIGDSVTNFRLKVVQDNPANGWIMVISNKRGTAGRTGAKILFDQSNLASWIIGQPADVDAFVIEGGPGLAERMRIDSAGETTVNGPLVFGPRSKNAWPTIADLPAGKIAAYKNTANGERRLYWNDGGTMVFTNFLP